MTEKRSETTPLALLATAELSDAAVSHLDVLKKLRIVIRAAQRHSAWVEKQCGVSGAQLWIMQELQDSPGLRVGEIALRLAIHQTTTSNLLDELGKRGYVTKTRDTKDQRAVHIALTDEGHRLLTEAPKPARGLLPEALRQMDDASRARLDAGLKGLLDSIGTMDDGFGLVALSFTT